VRQSRKGDEEMDRVDVLVRKNGLWEIKYHDVTRKDAKHLSKVIGMQGYTTKISPVVKTDA